MIRLALIATLCLVSAAPEGDAEAMEIWRRCQVVS